MAAWLKYLSKTFQDDPLIDEYALMPEVSAALFGIDKSSSDQDLGIFADAVAHKLAISVEAALVLYLHSHQVMLEAQESLSSNKDGSEASQAVKAHEASRAVLLCSADCASAWQCREKLLALGSVKLKAELQFSALLLRTNHKSGESWAQRRRLLAEAFHKDDERAEEVVKTELALIEELARRYDHHYYAWNHWAWLSGEARRLASGLPDRNFPKLAHATPSHYGLFHHRLVRLGNVLRDAVKEASGMSFDGLLPENALQTFTEEHRLASELLKTFPHLEAPWAFRAQLFALLLDSSEEYCTSASYWSQVADLWRSEVTSATATRSQVEDIYQEVVQRLSNSFEVQLLQELVSHFVLLEDVQTLTQELILESSKALERLEEVEAVAPAVVKLIRNDISAVTVKR
eukprot:TRINITY_DN111594_c0_g1_i1.p1 TRINITY_DN111594_c0_g1~~TRINITY_DN111594_c0_g1_i1.p1  ORF type:complete len:404 (+),score=87.09 TRINITY_DN111594_c0_g1_i1:65-1276(+)